MSRSVKGFTITEMMVALAIFSIMAFAAVPGVVSFFRSFDKRNAEMQILQDLRLAQARSVEQGCNGIFQINDDDYDFGCDYVPYNDPPSIDTVLFSRDLPSKVNVTSDDLIIFNSRGQVVNDQYFLSSRTLDFEILEEAGYVNFNTATLSATGALEFAN